MWNVSWLCNRFSHKQRARNWEQKSSSQIFFFFFLHSRRKLTHCPPPPHDHHDCLITKKKQQKESMHLSEYLYTTEGKLCDFVGWHSRSTYVIAGQKTGSWEKGFSEDWFLFSQVWLWDTPNLLTHIHPTLLCTGLKCVWERERQEKERLRSVM